MLRLTASVLVAAVLTACMTVTPAQERGLQPGRGMLTQVLVTGTVMAPAGVVAAGAGNVVAAGAGNWRTLGLDEQPLAGARVRLAADASVPESEGVTDARGRFSIVGAPAGRTFWVLVDARLGDRSLTLKALAAPRAEGGAQVAVDGASTIAAAAVEPDAALGGLDQEAYGRVRERIRKGAATDEIDWADPAGIKRWLLARVAADAELATALAALKAELRAPVSPAASPSPGADTPAASPATERPVPPALPETHDARYGGVCAVLDRAVYLTGGHDGLAPLGTVETAAVAQDGTLGPFTRLAARMRSPREGHASVVVGRNLYVLGGRDAGALATIERAPILDDGTLGPFIEAGSLTIPRHAPAWAIVGGHLYLFGGATIGGAYNDTVERAPITAGTLGEFSTVAGLRLPSGRSGMAAVVVGDAVVLSGGWNGGALDALLALRPGAASPAFTSVGRLPAPRAGHVMVASKGRLVVAGGSAGDLDTVDAAPLGDGGRPGAFAPVASLALPRHFPASLLLDDALYVIGGRSGRETESLKSSERLAL